MATVVLEGFQMARRSVKPGEPIGPIIAQNLYRLGYADIVVRSTELSRLISENTGRSMSRQRVAAVMNSVNVDPDTIATIADAIGVDPSELTKR